MGFQNNICYEMSLSHISKVSSALTSNIDASILYKRAKHTWMPAVNVSFAINARQSNKKHN